MQPTMPKTDLGSDLIVPRDERKDDAGLPVRTEPVKRDAFLPIIETTPKYNVLSA